MCLLRAQQVLDDMADELQEQLTRSEVLGEQGDVDGSQAAASLAEAIKVLCCPHSACMPEQSAPGGRNADSSSTHERAVSNMWGICAGAAGKV